MYLIISPIKIEKLQKYHFIRDERGYIDFEKFYQTSDGVEFANINPLIIEPAENKKSLISSITGDIAWISLCYNIPLYIYVMADKWYYKNLDFSNLRSRRNFGKCTEMSNLHHLEGYALNSPEVTSLQVDINTTYYKGDMEIIEKEISKIILDKSFNLRENPIQCIRLTAKNGFQFNA